MEIELTVEKGKVYDEVSQTTEYTGAKMDDPTAYERVATIDEDQSMLARFWDEARAEACQSLKHEVVAEGMNGNDYVMRLNVSASFDDTLVESMGIDLFGFFVLTIVSKWYTLANKGEAEAYAAQAKAALESLRRKVLHKKKPTRPTYD